MIRCYKYWAVPASSGDADLLNRQLKLGGDYRRQLVDIENRSRALLRALWAWPMRSIPIPDRDAWREAGGNAELKTWTASTDYKAWRQRIMDAQRAAGRWARKIAVESGLHYGTYWTVEEAVATSVRTTKWQDDLGNRSHNKVGAPIDANTKPLSTELATHTRFRLGDEMYALGASVDGYRLRATGESRNRSGNVRPKRLRVASIRVGSTKEREPIWGSLHVLMHRPLPEGKVAQAWAQRQFVGGRAKWQVVIAVEMEDVSRTHAAPDAKIAVDVGWRRRDNGVRIAYWLASDGKEGEFVIPVEVERRKAKSDDLRSIRDTRRNLMLEQLLAWVADHPGTWLDAALAHAAQWLKIQRYIHLERTWREQRVPGDAGIFSALGAFLAKDRHLYAWQAHNLTKMQRQIRGRLDTWAHDMCKLYGTVVIEDLDLTQLKEQDDDHGIAARSIQRLAPGEVFRALKQAAGRYGATVVAIDPAYTTIACASCGELREIDDQTKLVLACDKCGVAEDQDRTAARNLLAARSQSAEGPAPRKSPLKQSARRTRKRKEVTDQPLRE